MPIANLPLVPQPPAPLSADEIIFIKDTIKRFYGDDAIVRNFGADPARMELHVETSQDIGLAHYDCCGILMSRIDRGQIAVEVTRRGRRVSGRAGEPKSRRAQAASVARRHENFLTLAR